MDHLFMFDEYWTEFQVDYEVSISTSSLSCNLIGILSRDTLCSRSKTGIRQCLGAGTAKFAGSSCGFEISLEHSNEC